MSAEHVQHCKGVLGATVEKPYTVKVEGDANKKRAALRAMMISALKVRGHMEGKTLTSRIKGQQVSFWLEDVVEW